MRVKSVALFFFICSLAWGVPNAAFAVTIFYAQTDASTQSGIPPNHHGTGQVFIPAVSGNAKTIVIRTTPGNNGSFNCAEVTASQPGGSNMMRLAIRPADPVTGRPMWGNNWAWYVASSTAPDADGNCFYNSFHTADSYQNYYYYPYSRGTLTDGALVAGNTYMVMINDPYLNSSKDSFGGSLLGAGAGSLDGTGVFTPGRTGILSYFMTISDTNNFVSDHNVGISGTSTPPIASPVITLLGATTTAVEFGSVFTDPGATALDALDGDLTSTIVLTGSVDTSIIGTTTLTYSVTNSHGLSATTTRAVVVACTHDCNSSVLFLPGIEGSRLYEGTGCGKAAEEKLWEPIADSITDIAWDVLRGAGDARVHDLALTSAGTSACTDIYTKEGDVVDTVRGSNIYKSLIDEMNEFETAGTISDWKSVAYDWRLSLDELLTKGAQHGDKIYYNEATSTPYIEQTLRALAGSSKTGKVTIIAHSNGGLVTKALLNALGGPTAKSLVDKIIMVGVPQSGAPESIGSTLVGYNAGIYKYNFPIVSNAAARSLIQNSPMAYHLLPSESYFGSAAIDVAHPVVRFSGNAYTKEVAAYGGTITNTTELDDFLLAREGGREKPASSDLGKAEILNSTLISYANSTHTALDAWTPPEGIEVSQIAGWGVDTVGGVDFYTTQLADAITALEPLRTYRPIFIEDGDGTVPVPSALLMASSTDVKRYWVDLSSYYKDTRVKHTHADLFEIPSLRDFIKNILKNSTSTLPTYISTNQPTTQEPTKKLTFFLHSPLTLELTDSSGNVTGLASDGSISEDIPGSTYGEFGEVKYISVPQGSTYELSMHGQATGTFSLDIQESSGGVVTNSSTIANVPTTESTLASLTISDGISTASALAVDESGDGSNVITLAPVVGETVTYEPPAPQVAPAQTGGGAGGDSPVTITAVQAVSEPEADTSTEVPTIATTTQLVATTTPAVTTPVLATTTVIVAASLSRSPAVIPHMTKNPPKSQPLAPASNTPQNLLQTASVYGASQQPLLKRWGATVYNGLHGFWSALSGLFRSK